MIEVHTVNQKKAKKVHRFLQYERKKMIDVHIVNQKKQRKYIDSYNTNEKKKMIDVHTVNQKNKEFEILAKILCGEYMFIVK